MTWRIWRWPLANLILLGLVLGASAGVLVDLLVTAPGARASLEWWIATVVHPVGRVFIRLIFMIVIPLVFAAIVLGVAEMGDVRRLGRIGYRALLFTLLLSGTGVLLGITLVNVLEPGRALPVELRDELRTRYAQDAVAKVAQAAEKTSLSETLLNLIPQNPLAEAVHAFDGDNKGGGLLAVMFFSLLFGIALTLVPREKSATFVEALQGLFEVCMVVIGLAMKLAPLGVACLTFALTATLGLDVLRSLAFYAAVVVGGLALHQFGTYSILLRVLGRTSPLRFFRDIREAMVTAFATSSSNATLPVSLRVARDNLGLPSDVSRFVLTVGASANQNGTALYEGVTALFLAQVFGVELTLMQQLIVVLMCILASFGTAGVPGGSLPLVVGVLVAIGLPGESIAVIYGIDRFLDMCRTSVNVTGDMVCAVLVARGANPTPDGGPGRTGPVFGPRGQKEPLILHPAEGSTTDVH